MNRTSKTIYFFVTFVFLSLFDKFFSDLILANTEKLPQNPLFDLIFMPNSGAAFSILQDSRLFLIIFSVTALLLIIFYTMKHISKSSGFGIFFAAMMCSGILCNTCERIFYGFVRDYIKLNFIDFPIFNISDIFINISVFAIVFIIIKNNYIKNNETGN